MALYGAEELQLNCPPILFLTFNRPDTTARVFESIRAARPARLYVAADGPRLDKAGEAERCAKVRHIATAVDWPCEVQTLFRDENLGCRRAVSGAITWFFEQEEEGIILEDDTLPDPTFFLYCGELLARFRDDQRIMAICGGCYFPQRMAPSSSYCFSHVFDPWGWATWKRAWDRYDADLSDLEVVVEGGDLEKLGPKSMNFASHWKNVFEATKRGKYDTWDYQWTFTIFRDGGLVAVPRANLISNVGFGDGATHTTYAASPLAALPLKSLQFPLKHPKDFDFDPRREMAMLALRHCLIRRSVGRRSKLLIRSAMIRLIGQRRWERLMRLRSGLIART